jgi:penicillin amidase
MVIGLSRWVYRFLLMLATLALLAGSVAWLALRSSLPHYDGSAYIAGLAAPVTVERDSLGTATVRADSHRDLARALGYVHAQERFFEMDLLRRQAAGELAELFGPAALPMDRKSRVHRMRARASAALSQLPVEHQQLLAAYRDGVNSGLDGLSSRPFPYLLVRSHPVAWRSEDSLLAVGAMFFTLNDEENYRELAFSTMRAALPASAFRFLSAKGGEWDAPLAGAALHWPPPPSVEELDLRKLAPGLIRNTEEYNGYLPGSNSFAVGGALTGGPALVGNDMHLGLRVPNIWFRTRLVYPDPQRPGRVIDVSGASLPGTPAITVGSNGKIAWSFTNSYGDFLDWVRVTLRPGDDFTYRSAEGWKPLSVYREILHVRNAPDEPLDIYETEWGPILAVDHDGSPLALAWTAHRPGSVNMELAFLEQAETLEQAIVIAQKAGMPPQNFIVGDRPGRIAWTIAGRIPFRMGNYEPTLPSDWSVSGTGWNGWLSPEEYPLIIDPPSQRLWSANARLVEGAMLDKLGDGGYDLGARARQVRDDLFELQRFSPADMLAIQLDDRALFLGRWRALLDETLKRAKAEPWRAEMQQAMQDWNGHASIDSVAYRLVREFRQEVIRSVLDGFAAAVRVKYPSFTLPKLNQAEHAVWMLMETRPPHLLPSIYADWQDMLGSCAQRLAERMRNQPGGIAARTWGEHNTASIRHPLSRNLPGFVAKRLDMPKDELPGDTHMPRVQGRDFGASNRLAVAPGVEEQGYFEMPGGQSGHPLSPYYGSGHADWVAGKPTPFLPGQAQRILRLHPANRNQ